MNIRISPIVTDQSVKILKSQNTTCKLLYNEVKKIVDQNKLPASFHNLGIDLPTTTKEVLKQLNSLGIKYSK